MTTLSSIDIKSSQVIGDIACGFGDPDLRVERLVARPGGIGEDRLPPSQKGRPSVGDILSIQFNQALSVDFRISSDASKLVYREIRSNDVALRDLVYFDSVSSLYAGYVRSKAVPMFWWTKKWSSV